MRIKFIRNHILFIHQSKAEVLGFIHLYQFLNITYFKCPPSAAKHFRILSFGDIDWPPRFPDLLTSPDFCLWGYLKNKVCSNNTTTLENLKSNIRNVTNSINFVTLQNVMASTVERMRKCLSADGGHLKYVIYSISNTFYTHYLFSVRPNLIYTQYILIRI